MKKVILLTNIPTPYRVALFNVLNQELTDRGFVFKVIFGAVGYARRQWQIDMKDCRFPYDVLTTTALRFSDPEQSSFTYNGLFRMLRRERPDVIITNGFSIATTKLWFRSFLRPTRYLIWSGAIPIRGSDESWLRLFQRKLLVRRSTGFIAYGSNAKDYLVNLGAPVESISIGINTVDTSYYSSTAAEVRRRTETGKLPKTLVYVGHLTPGKKIDRLLRAVKHLSTRRNDFAVEIVGDGSEAGNLKSLSRELCLENIVRFEGFQQKDRIARYLASAYCFLFPSTYDVWGLVLVEAMAAGVPCLSSPDAGATRDLIQEGKTGFVTDFSDADRVAEKLDWLLEHPDERERIGQRARDFIREHVTLSKSGEGFIEAIDKSLHSARK